MLSRHPVVLVVSTCTVLCTNDYMVVIRARVQWVPPTAMGELPAAIETASCTAAICAWLTAIWVGPAELILSHHTCMMLVVTAWPAVTRMLCCVKCLIIEGSSSVLGKLLVNAYSMYRGTELIKPVAEALQWCCWCVGGQIANHSSCLRTSIKLPSKFSAALALLVIGHRKFRRATKKREKRTIGDCAAPPRGYEDDKRKELQNTLIDFSIESTCIYFWREKKGISDFEAIAVCFYYAS